MLVKIEIFLRLTEGCPGIDKWELGWLLLPSCVQLERLALLSLDRVERFVDLRGLVRLFSFLSWQDRPQLWTIGPNLLLVPKIFVTRLLGRPIPVC